MSYEPTIILQCPHCEEHIGDEGDLTGPVYECSRCGSTEVVEPGERARCGSCNVFMAKQAPASCPQCAEGLDPSELEPVERYHAADGTYHETADEAAEWDANTPARLEREAAAQAQAAADLDEHIARNARELALRVTALQLATELCPVKLAYYSGPRVWTWESREAHITPAEFYALAGAEPGDLDAALAFAAEHGVWVPINLDCVSFGVRVDQLVPMLRACAERTNR